MVLLVMPISMIIAIILSTVIGQPMSQLQLTSEFKVFDDELILSMIILALVPILRNLVGELRC